MIQKQRMSFSRPKENSEALSKQNRITGNCSHLTNNESNNDPSMIPKDQQEIDYYVKSDQIRISRFRDLLNAVLNIHVKKYEVETVSVKRNNKKYDCFFNKSEVRENMRKDHLLRTLVAKKESNTTTKKEGNLILSQKAFSTAEIPNKISTRNDQTERWGNREKFDLRLESIKYSKRGDKKISDTNNESSLTADDELNRQSINLQNSGSNNRNLTQVNKTDLSLTNKGNKKTVNFQTNDLRKNIQIKETEKGKEKETGKPKKIGFFCCS